MPPEAVSDATELADIVARVVLRRALRDHVSVEHDPERLDAVGPNPAAPTQPEAEGFSRRVIHRATGMILVQLNLSATDAVLLLHGYAFSNGRSVLQTLVERCALLFGASAVGIILAAGHGRRSRGFEVVASTNERTRLVEILQLRAGAGPCVECMTTGAAVAIPELDVVAPKWPLVRAGALEQGFLSIARAQLQHALNSRVVIEQAKGVIAFMHDVDMNEAFTMLRHYARSHSRPLAEVSAAVVDRTLRL
ncbi:ANTAR domain-containing protein [Cryobacterium sp. GrIS_2_6]|uniref:ANTAR domain-containing protein n=1 Tax=Cryobacterium sp. GrIS_2_6 TaxID=3162785 RepID=UPI002DFEEFA4|nr:hypothetical protein [Cryobacterium psychrotolerans]